MWFSCQGMSLRKQEACFHFEFWGRVLDKVRGLKRAKQRYWLLKNQNDVGEPCRQTKSLLLIDASPAPLSTLFSTWEDIPT